MNKLQWVLGYICAGEFIPLACFANRKMEAEYECAKANEGNAHTFEVRQVLMSRDGRVIQEDK